MVGPEGVGGEHGGCTRRLRGWRRISAPRTARSDQSRLPGLVRRSTVTSCRSTSSSMSLDVVDRPGRTSQPQSRMKIWPAEPAGYCCPTCGTVLTLTAGDISADMLAWCRSRAGQQALAPALYRQAMHKLNLPRAYQTVYVCGAFGLGGDRGHDQEGLRRFRDHLRPGGALVPTRGHMLAPEARPAAGDPPTHPPRCVSCRCCLWEIPAGGGQVFGSGPGSPPCTRRSAGRGRAAIPCGGARIGHHRAGRGAAARRGSRRSPPAA